MTVGADQSDAAVEAQLRQCIKLQAIAEMVTPSTSDAIGALIGAIVLIARSRANPDEILAVARESLQQCRDKLAELAENATQARQVAS